MSSGRNGSVGSRRHVRQVLANARALPLRAACSRRDRVGHRIVVVHEPHQRSARSASAIDHSANRRRLAGRDQSLGDAHELGRLDRALVGQRFRRRPARTPTTSADRRAARTEPVRSNDITCRARARSPRSAGTDARVRGRRKRSARYSEIAIDSVTHSRRGRGTGTLPSIARSRELRALVLGGSVAAAISSVVARAASPRERPSRETPTGSPTSTPRTASAPPYGEITTTARRRRRCTRRPA